MTRAGDGAPRRPAPGSTPGRQRAAAPAPAKKAAPRSSAPPPKRASASQRAAPARPTPARATAPKPARAKAPTQQRSVTRPAAASKAGTRRSAPSRPATGAPVTGRRGGRSDSSGPGRRRSGPPRVKAPHRRLLALLLASIALAAFLLVGVFPTRSLLAQRSETGKAAAELKALEVRNAELDRRIERLQTPEEIERIARKEYGLVNEGEESYAILPAPPPPVELADTWPFTGVADLLNR